MEGDWLSVEVWEDNPVKVPQARVVKIRKEITIKNTRNGDFMQNPYAFCYDCMRFGYRESSD